MNYKISYDDFRQKFLDFFVSKNHKLIKNSSLIPENDPTVLFTTAGMQPLVPYLLGEKHPEGRRLTNVQRCVRTVDIGEVGDISHFTFFEMLGNWSLGDYFKEEAIKMSFEFLTQVLKINKKELAVTVWIGNESAPKDVESYNIWKTIGLEDSQICWCEDNWWGPAGITGPCGPCSEMFFNTQGEKCSPTCGPLCKCGRYLEIWNDVFMEYNKNSDGSFSKLAQQNVDTGMGLERTLGILNGFKDNYETELFSAVLAKLAEISGKKYQNNLRAFRKIADHTRTAVFLLGDENGIAPSNIDQGYILRRLIRIAIRNLKQLEVSGHVLAELAEIYIEKYKKYYPILETRKDFILHELNKEEILFNRTIHSGLKELAKVLEKLQSNDTIRGEIAFKLYDTYGFPLEFTEEIASEKGVKVDVAGFNKFFAEHQEKSRRGAEQKFKGGLADHSEITTRLHTATHILHTVLRKNFGQDIKQKGSNITAERMRFDFSFDRKFTPDELKFIEQKVNEVIEQNLEVQMEEMMLEEAQQAGAIGLFTNKYDKEKVKVYSVGKFSKEICGGPHVKNTSEMGHFRILKEEASSAGVRRIKAVLE
ncbi:MAG: alanine--tRNA ligase [Deltaproteobacteria bacterium]|jgi:alanyl-tRNA synthetase|nr:alanine--tRNA ligase [Deltaproteobacteria bacterium]